MIQLQKKEIQIKKMAGVLNRHFFPKEKTNQYMQRCPTSLIIREMQIKTMRCHFIALKIASIKKTRNQSISKNVEKRESCELLLGM